MNIYPQYFFIFDVESLGLHGEGFAVAGGAWKNDGTNILEFAFHCPFTKSCNNLGHRSDFARVSTPDDWTWIDQNVHINLISQPCLNPLDVRERFWKTWMTCKETNSEIVMAVECGWPVEARFLEDCIKDNPRERNWQGPYPLHEIATYMLAAGMDPMATYERKENELPAHEPLADARLSARLLFEAIEILKKPRFYRSE